MLTLFSFLLQIVQYENHSQVIQQDMAIKPAESQTPGERPQDQEVVQSQSTPIGQDMQVMAPSSQPESQTDPGKNVFTDLQLNSAFKSTNAPGQTIDF
jgi:hypothetical protein